MATECSFYNVPDKNAFQIFLSGGGNVKNAPTIILIIIFNTHYYILFIRVFLLKDVD